VEDSNRISYFLFGLGVGVAVGVLLAPKAGEETRHYLREKTDEGREYVKRRSTGLREQAGDLVDRGKETVTRQKSQLDAALNAGKQAYREVVETPSGSDEAATEG